MTKDEVLEIASNAGFYFRVLKEHAPIQHAVEHPYSEYCFERAFAEVERRTIERCIEQMYDATDNMHEEEDMVLKEIIATAIRELIK